MTKNKFALSRKKGILTIEYLFVLFILCFLIKLAGNEIWNMHTIVAGYAYNIVCTHCWENNNLYVDRSNGNSYCSNCGTDLDSLGLIQLCDCGTLNSEPYCSSCGLQNSYSSKTLKELGYSLDKYKSEQFKYNFRLVFYLVVFFLLIAAVCTLVSIGLFEARLWFKEKK